MIRGENIDVRKTREFQEKRSKDLFMTIDQYLGKEPLITIFLKSPKIK